MTRPWNTDIAKEADMKVGDKLYGLKIGYLDLMRQGNTDLCDEYEVLEVTPAQYPEQHAHAMLMVNGNPHHVVRCILKDGKVGECYPTPKEAVQADLKQVRESIDALREELEAHVEEAAVVRAALEKMK